MSQGTPPAFFSYAREDSDFALRLAGDLKAAGAYVWLDQLDIRPGQRWDRAVEEALTQCTRMLIVLSPDAVDSTNVMDEVSFALEEHKTIIPIVYRDCTMPFRLRRLQHLDFRQDYARAFDALVRTLVSGTEPVPAMPTVAVTPGKPNHDRPIKQSPSEVKPRQAAEHHPRHKLEGAAGRTQRDAGAHLGVEQSPPMYEQARASGREHRRDDLPGPRASFDLTALWPVVDRFGGLCWLALAFALPGLAWQVGLGTQDTLQYLVTSEWYTKVFGIVCPSIAAILPAIPEKRIPIKYLTTTFGAMSLLAPIIGLFAAAAVSGFDPSAGYLGLVRIHLTLPFLIAGLFASGASTLPTVPASRHAWTRVALLVGSAFMLLNVAMSLHWFNFGYRTGAPWLSDWLLRLAGMPRP